MFLGDLLFPTRDILQKTFQRLQISIYNLQLSKLSHIKYTNDFLRKLTDLKDLPDQYLLCTIDVVGLYPNIPHDEGIVAIKRALERRKDKSVTTESLVELTKLELTKNIFEHNER